MADALRKEICRFVQSTFGNGNDLPEFIGGAIRVEVLNPAANSTLLKVYTNETGPPRWFEVHVKEFR